LRAASDNATSANHAPATRLIDPERFARIGAERSRLNARSGRNPAEPYLLRGIARCTHCDSTLCTRRYAPCRHYICASAREARGTCEWAKPIPAEIVERAVIDHLSGFGIAVKQWIGEPPRFSPRCDRTDAPSRPADLCVPLLHDAQIGGTTAATRQRFRVRVDPAVMIPTASRRRAVCSSHRTRT
jgi:hypothetical protein